MDFENDLELERCDEELRRLDERRKKILERKNRRIRQIREKQLKDKEVWMKKLIPLLDKTLEDCLGSLYWYGCSVEDICGVISKMEIPAETAREEASSVSEKSGKDEQKQPGQQKTEKNAGNHRVDDNTEE